MRKATCNCYLARILFARLLSNSTRHHIVPESCSHPEFQEKKLGSQQEPRATCSVLPAREPWWFLLVGIFLEGMKQTPGEMKFRIKCTQPQNSICVLKKKSNMYEHGKISKQYRRIHNEKSIFPSTLVSKALCKNCSLPPKNIPPYIKISQRLHAFKWMETQ